MLNFSSVSLVEPNLMYWKSFESLNLSFVVLSKHLTMCSKSSWNGESARKPGNQVGLNQIQLLIFNILSRNILAWMLTNTEPWKWPKANQKCFVIVEENESYTLGRGNFFKIFFCGSLVPAIRTNIDCSTSGINNDDPFSILVLSLLFTPRKWEEEDETHLHCPNRQSILNGKVQTRFTFCHECQSRIPSSCIWDQSSNKSCLPHLLLLCTFPSVWMRKNKIDLILDWFPKGRTVCMCIFNVVLGAQEQIFEKVGKYIHDTLV